MNEEELFNRYLTATMTAEDQLVLKELLASVEGGSRFRDFVEETGLYINLAEETMMCQTYDSRKSMRVTKRRITQTNIKIAEQKEPIKMSVVLTAVAAALLIGGLVFLTVLSSKNTIGMTTDVASVNIERSSFDLGFGTEGALMTGDVVTALETDVKLVLNDGSELQMDQGAMCSITQGVNGFDIRQLRGRVEYNVEKQQAGKNFEVFTNGIRTTVIGTRFTVEATGHKEKVRVLEGLVKVDNYADLKHFINPGEFAMADGSQKLNKAMAMTGMKINEIVVDYMGNEIYAETLEERPYLLVVYAQKWDPSSRKFIHKLKDFYQEYKGSFEVVLINDQDSFAKEYEMPWPLIKAASKTQAEDLLGVKQSSFPLNILLLDQHGTTMARSVANNEWLGADHVLDAIKSNLIK